MLRLLRWLTVEQWRRIDEDHLREGVDRRAAITLVAIAIALLLNYYVGGPEHFARSGWPKRLASLPYDKLHPHIWWAGFKLVTYVTIPVLVIKLVYRERVRDFGFAGRASRKLWGLYAAMLGVVGSLAFIASGSPRFQAKYPKYSLAGRSWTDLAMWEGINGLQFATLEFFFRGFALFALARTMGHLAVFVMVVPYTMIHFGKPAAETAGAIVTGIALGTLALRTRSIWGGIVLHVAIAWSMDLFMLGRKGQLVKLLGWV